MVDEHTKLMDTLHNAEEGESSASAEAGKEASGEGAMAKSESGQIAPGLKIKNFGSWEPKSFEGPFGKGRIIGPVGYYVSWGSGPEGKEAEGKEAEKKEEDQTTEEAAATAEGMEQ